MIDFTEVLILNDPSPRLHMALRDKRPQMRIFLWGNDGGDLSFYHTLANHGVKIMAHSSLHDEVENKTTLKVTPFRDVDVKGDASISRKTSVIREQSGPILFCPLNDTHSMMFAPVAKHLPGAKFMLPFIKQDENAVSMLQSLGIEPIICEPKQIKEIRPSVIIFGNDWNDAMREVCWRAAKLRIPTACIQEGCLDFDTRPRMGYSDFPMIQGPIMPMFLSRPAYLATGNSRFDSISRRPLPAKPRVMINCNFTYGIHEEERERWVRVVVESCMKWGLDYFISQHPRDKGRFPDYNVRPSHAGVVHDHLTDATILVTRFSTLIYEAMIMGRRVVYFNPFGEKMRLFNEDRTGGLLKAMGHDDLPKAMERAATTMDAEEQMRFDQFVALHCGAADGCAATRVAGALQWLARCANPMPRRGFLSYLGI